MDTTKSEVYLTMEKETLVKIIDNKRECIKMLKQRIDKAIEYIEKYKSGFKNYNLSDMELNYLYLLDILKGGEENE